jgi:hypothetical protein
MSKTIMALIAIFAISGLIGTSITLADAAKPVTTEDFNFSFSFNNNWCGGVDDSTLVSKTIVGTTTIFGGDKYKIEINETVELYNIDDELIGKGFGSFKEQGNLPIGDEKVVKNIVKINCLNGEQNPSNINTGYTITKNAKVAHGN